VSTPAKPVILAVDDAAELLALIGKALIAEYKVKLASDGAKALALAAEEPLPDLILLDVGLPGASGFDVCRQLKAQPATADIPVIFLTGKAEAADQVEGLDLGAVDYITKPVNAKLLLARVRTHLALANRRAELERQVESRTAQLEDARVQLIRRLARAMEFHESAAAGNKGVRVAQYVKLLAQAAAQGRPVDAIVHAAGSGGTQAGLLVAAQMLAADVRVIGISVSEPAAALSETVAELAGRTARLLGTAAPPRTAVEVLDGYIGADYGQPTAGMRAALHACAALEGLYLDPVYSGKAMAGLIDLVRRGRFAPDQTVAFVHTGGTPALFAYLDALSD